MPQFRFNFRRSIDHHADACRVNDLSYCRPDGMLVAAIEVNECKLQHDIENGI